MDKKSVKKKAAWQQYIGMAFFVLLGAACGVIMVIYAESAAGADSPLWQRLLSLLGLLVIVYISLFIQIVIHETGHLIFGLLSGYRFSSLRIMNLMWVREEEHLKLRHLNIAGTGGQCLMSPPELINGKIPFLLYNLGGALANLLTAAIFIILYFVFADMPYLSAAMLIFSVIGAFFAAMNGIPMRMGTVDNDGFNALSLSKNPSALYAFWLQMKMNEQVARGIRLKDMPDEWFTVPSDEQMKDSMIACTGVFACSRLMDAHRFDEAKRLMLHLLEIDSAIIGLHRSLMTCDLIYLELIGENRCEHLNTMLTKEQQKFMKTMKSYPSVLRTEYAIALLEQRDQKKAEKIKARFEMYAKKYPYPNDVQSERELMEIAEAR